MRSVLCCIDWDCSYSLFFFLLPSTADAERLEQFRRMVRIALGFLLGVGFLSGTSYIDTVCSPAPCPLFPDRGRQARRGAPVASQDVKIS